MGALFFLFLLRLQCSVTDVGQRQNPTSAPGSVQRVQMTCIWLYGVCGIFMGFCVAFRIVTVAPSKRWWSAWGSSIEGAGSV